MKIKQAEFEFGLNRRLIRFAAISLVISASIANTAISIAGGVGPGRCVPCPQCPPCGGGSGSNSSGGSSGRGVPMLFCIFVPSACQGWSNDSGDPPPPPKVKYPQAFKDRDRVRDQIRDDMGEWIIRTNPKKMAVVEQTANLTVAPVGSAFFSPPGGYNSPYLPNPPSAELHVPTGPKIRIDGTLKQLKYALAIIKKADESATGYFPDLVTQRFLLNQAGQMMAGQPVQLYLGDLDPVPATHDDLRAIEEIIRDRQRLREKRVEWAKKKRSKGAEAKELEAEVRQLNGGERLAIDDDRPLKPSFANSLEEQEELASSYERYLLKDKELREAYLEKAAAVIKKQPTIGFHFSTKILAPPAPEKKNSEKCQAVIYRIGIRLPI